MFLDERFTRKLLDIINISKKDAKRMKMPSVTVELLLLALIKQGSNLAITILKQAGIDTGNIKDKIEEEIEEDNELFLLEQPVGMSEDAISVIEQARNESAEMGRHIIGTEHLLLGILKNKDCKAARLLKEEGLNYKKAQDVLLSLFADARSTSSKKLTKKRNKEESIEMYTRNLTELAAEGKLDPVIGREREIERVIQILCRRKKDNPVLIGEPGVGKTAIVEGLSQRIVRGKIPKPLANKSILSLDLASVIAGTKYRGQFEKRLKSIINKLKESDDIIIFIDEIHTIVGAGAAEGAIDASNMLKPALARGEIQAIGATTTEEYRKHIEKDGALERRFQILLIDPPTVKETIDILHGIKGRYADFHNVEYNDDSIDSAARLSYRYITDRNLPDKAIDVLDEAGSRVKLKSSKVPNTLIALEEELSEIKQELSRVRKEGKYEIAIDLRDRRDEIANRLKEEAEKIKEENKENKPVVIEDDIRDVISNWTGIPIAKLKQEETEKLLNMEAEIEKRLVGQHEAVKVVSKAIRRGRAGFRDPRRPLGAFLFLGPTGVGKTELAKQLAKFLFNTDDALIRVDMSEFMEKFNVSKLIGAPPGYVGYEEGGILTEAVRRRPYSVILLDEIEKAHNEVFNILLQIFDDGILTDAYGRKIAFKNTVIIMTSNLGTKDIMRGSQLGFKKMDQSASYEKMKEYLLDKIKDTFNPEFLNRLDETVVFHSLDRKIMKSIVEIFFNEIKERVEEKGYEISLTDEAKDFLIEKGFDPEYGARPLKRVMQKYLEDRLAEDFLQGKWEKGTKIIVSREGDKLIFFSSQSMAKVY